MGVECQKGAGKSGAEEGGGGVEGSIDLAGIRMFLGEYSALGTLLHCSALKKIQWDLIGLVFSVLWYDAKHDRLEERVNRMLVLILAPSSFLLSGGSH